MLTLSGFAQVVAVENSRGRFYSVKLETPEEVTFDATLWTDGASGILRPPVLEGIFFFTGYLAGSTSLELTTFVPAPPPHSDEPPSPTIVNVTGCPSGLTPLVDHVVVDVEVYLREKKTKITVPFKFYLRGSRWETRRSALRTNCFVHFLGTLESASSAELDQFAVLREMQTSVEGSPSPQSRARKPWVGRAKRAHSPTPGSSDIPSPDQQGLLPAISSPNQLKLEDRPLKRGRTKVTPAD